MSAARQPLGRGRRGANASHRAERGSYGAVMARRTQRRCIPAAGQDAVLAQIRSPSAGWSSNFIDAHWAVKLV